MSSESKETWVSWPAAFAISVGALALAGIIYALSMSDAAQYEAQVENNRLRVQHDQWLLENGYIEEPRIR